MAAGVGLAWRVSAGRQGLILPSAILIMAYVPCRLVRQERTIGGKRLRFPQIKFIRDHAKGMAGARFAPRNAGLAKRCAGSQLTP